ncbi:MAG: hypothetical protein AB4290_31120 [Spirulina sp.]
MDLTGWQLQVATAISSDGLSVVGDGVNPDGDREAWLARLDLRQMEIALRTVEVSFNSKFWERLELERVLAQKLWHEIEFCGGAWAVLQQYKEPLR